MQWTISEKTDRWMMRMLLAGAGAAILVLFLAFTVQLPELTKLHLMDLSIVISVLDICGALLLSGARKRSRKGRNIAQQLSRLVLLPAELRTQIWHYIVPNTVTLSKQQPMPKIPSVAHVCRQTYHETMPLFFTTPTFRFYVLDADGTFMCYSIKQLQEQMDRKVVADAPLHVDLRLNGNVRWESFLAWANAVHAGGWSWYTTGNLGQLRETQEIIASTLLAAEKLRKTSWTEVKEVLGVLPAARDPRWA